MLTKKINDMKKAKINISRVMKAFFSGKASKIK